MRLGPAVIVQTSTTGHHLRARGATPEHARFSFAVTISPAVVADVVRVRSGRRVRSLEGITVAGVVAGEEVRSVGAGGRPPVHVVVLEVPAPHVHVAVRHVVGPGRCFRPARIRRRLGPHVVLSFQSGSGPHSVTFHIIGV